MGLGDAKLSFGIGLFLAPLLALSAIVLAFWIGAVISLGIIGYQYIEELLFHRKSLIGHVNNLTIKSEVPFAPFLVLGLYLVFFLDINIFTLWIF